MSLIRAILLFCAAVFPSIAAARDTRTTVHFNTVPPLSEVRPLSGPAKLLLRVSDGIGNPIEVGRLKIRLQAPSSRWPFSTDFPRVEGTLLSEMVAPVSRERVEWEYVFPIRGIYRLEVESADDEGRRIREVLEFRIKESRLKLLFLAAFLAGLFLFGVTAGRLFTASYRNAG